MRDNPEIKEKKKEQLPTGRSGSQFRSGHSGMQGGKEAGTQFDPEYQTQDRPERDLAPRNIEQNVGEGDDGGEGRENVEGRETKSKQDYEKNKRVD